MLKLAAARAFGAPLDSEAYRQVYTFCALARVRSDAREEASSTDAPTQVVSAEAAHVTAQRHIGLVEVPGALNEVAAEMAAGAPRQ
jgi:hypothetical protein